MKGQTLIGFTWHNSIRMYKIFEIGNNVRKLFTTSDFENASRFGNYLNSIKIENNILADEDEKSESVKQWALWVYDEDQLDEADLLKAEFLADPFNKKYDVKIKKIKEPAPPKAKGARYVDVRSEIFDKGSIQNSPVVMSVIIVCVILFLASLTPGYPAIASIFYYSQYMGREFPEILEGQVWRLVTPIFLHGGFIHVLFNMMWLHQLGSQIEKIDGSIKFFAFMIITAILCNTCQYLVSGANFVGMSGVVYGMLGFIWTVSRLAPRSRYDLNDQTMMFMMGWLVLCFFMENVANTEHVVGLLVGLAFGFIKGKRAA
jgi:GlpG protein